MSTNKWFMTVQFRFPDPVLETGQCALEINASSDSPLNPVPPVLSAIL